MVLLLLSVGTWAGQVAGRLDDLSVTRVRRCRMCAWEVGFCPVVVTGHPPTHPLTRSVGNLGKVSLMLSEVGMRAEWVGETNEMIHALSEQESRKRVYLSM